MQKVFVLEKSKFYTVAKDCKLQLTFDSELVDSYRLIGYENRLLNDDDFEDDSKDAGEIGASQTITAMYELILKNAGSKTSYAQFDFRYKKPNQDISRLLQMNINTNPVSIYDASENMRFCTAVTAFGLIMRQSQYKGTASKQMVMDLGENSKTFDPFGYRNEFIQLVQSWKP